MKNKNLSLSDIGSVHTVTLEFSGQEYSRIEQQCSAVIELLDERVSMEAILKCCVDAGLATLLDIERIERLKRDGSQPELEG